ncbi:MAG: alpha-amylase family glycosyl hydrolase [Candidatus Marinimicrobia bacterium]|nr:alpha-amylase family glycosyl hydrolase [Candidatus Neomarinimicrobiota bacterium]
MNTNSRPIKASDEKLGLIREGQTLSFRVYAPAVEMMSIIFFEQHDDVKGVSRSMTKNANGVWKISLPVRDATAYYAYALDTAPENQLADPYSRAVVRQNHFQYPTKTVILPQDEFDWEGDDFTKTSLGDMVILEAHLRDMSVHSTSGSSQGGTYLGFTESDQKGGIAHLKDMGYNTVEFLPLQEFGNIEIDFKNPELGIYNNWNPYENNHWGYMTSFFFAPEIYYGSDGVADRGAWVGQDGRAVLEMKQMVKALHAEGISVIMDVVYNHVSQYDSNPFKLIDKSYYFKLNVDGDYRSHSGCGNDFKTENPMARKMIVESLVYWMEEYHIDGFRFDLATMIDLETIDAITAATRAVNPAVVLIAEPWGGGGYNPAELAEHGWASWNDHFRNSIKGRNPRKDDEGFIFGKLWDGNSTEHYKKLMRGYLKREGGHYLKPIQSVNYLESHDDHTLGDFVRLALGKVGKHEAVTRNQVARLSAEELSIHKFAALNLLVSQGPVMIAQGQSWGRSKVIANSIGSDPEVGQLDHNSYEKDDETNWLNWDEKILNQDLVDYYRGLIAIRSKYPEIRNVDRDFRSFLKGENELSFGFSMGQAPQVIVFLNANTISSVDFDLTEGEWTILADAKGAGLAGQGSVSGSVKVPPQSGLIVVK